MNRGAGDQQRFSSRDSNRKSGINQPPLPRPGCNCVGQGGYAEIVGTALVDRPGSSLAGRLYPPGLLLRCRSFSWYSNHAAGVNQNAWPSEVRTRGTATLDAQRGTGVVPALWGYYACGNENFAPVVGRRGHPSWPWNTPPAVGRAVEAPAYLKRKGGLGRAAQPVEGL
jgi:hypothetical protein